MKNREEKLAELSEKLANLSIKAEQASIEAKEAREKKQDAIENSISTAKGDLAAFQEKVRLSEERGEGKLAAALLKAQMTIEAKRQQRKDNRDKACLEVFMNDRVANAVESLEMADYLIENAIVNYLELLAAAAEYDERFGGSEE